MFPVIPLSKATANNGSPGASSNRTPPEQSWKANFNNKQLGRKRETDRVSQRRTRQQSKQGAALFKDKLPGGSGVVSSGPVQFINLNTENSNHADRRLQDVSDSLGRNFSRRLSIFLVIMNVIEYSTDREPLDMSTNGFIETGMAWKYSRDSPMAQSTLLSILIYLLLRKMVRTPTQNPNARWVTTVTYTGIDRPLYPKITTKDFFSILTRLLYDPPRTVVLD